MALDDKLITKEKLKAFVSGVPEGLLYGMAIVGAFYTAQNIGEALNTRLGTSFIDEALIYGGGISAVGYSAYRTYRTWKATRRQNTLISK